MENTSKQQAGALKEIEITPEMAVAGRHVF
jgi:hypothetical protein